VSESDPNKCEVCGDTTHPLAYCCKRCKKIIDRVDVRRKINKKARLQALKESWDGEYFRCYYSGVRLIEDNPKDPRYITFDHRTPRQESDIVIASAVLNDMKPDMAEDEFRAMIIQLANSFTGKMIDESVFNLKHWIR
jgi:hypothetical protein